MLVREGRCRIVYLKLESKGTKKDLVVCADSSPEKGLSPFQESCVGQTVCSETLFTVLAVVGKTASA